MADTCDKGPCRECETWLTREPRRETLRGDVHIEIRRCHACAGNAANPWPVWTPADATCPAFRRRADAAERAARRIAEMLSQVMTHARELMIQMIIREEIAKDKEAAK